jgi:hypothetical protein
MNIRVCCILALSLTSISAIAADCREILSKLPSHNSDTSEFAMQVKNFTEGCKSRPNAEDPQVLNECVTVGMRSLAVAGNYIAAEKMAIMECKAGNEEISRNWIGMIINNRNAPQAEKDIAAQAIANQ